MKSEDQLIRLLAEDMGPVRRLRSPFSRTNSWILISGVWTAALVAVMGLRPDLAERGHDIRWLIEQGATLATAYFASMAAFCAVVPGRPRWEHAMPLLPLSVWVGTLGYGCYQSWSELGFSGLVFVPDWTCFPAIAGAAAGPALVMALMLRQGAPLAPGLTMALGALAASALGDFGLRFFHTQDASLTVLVWQVGSVFAFTALGAAAGRRFLAWRVPQLNSVAPK